MTGLSTSNRAKCAELGKYIVYESESDELNKGLADNVYHIYRYEVATGNKVLVTPEGQASNVDSKYENVRPHCV